MKHLIFCKRKIFRSNNSNGKVSCIPKLRFFLSDFWGAVHFKRYFFFLNSVHRNINQPNHYFFHYLYLKWEYRFGQSKVRGTSLWGSSFSMLAPTSILLLCYAKIAYKLMPSNFIQLDKLKSVYLRYSSTLDSYFFKTSRE